MVASIRRILLDFSFGENVEVVDNMFRPEMVGDAAGIGGFDSWLQWCCNGCGNNSVTQYFFGDTQEQG